MRQLEDYNPFDPEVAESPFEYYAALREQAPVYRTPMGFFMVSTHAMCLAAIRDPKAFSSRFAAAMAGGMGGSDALERDQVEEAPISPTDTLLTNDPPSHTRFRKLVNKAFSPRRVEKMHDYVSQIASDLIDGFEAEDQIDLVPKLAVPLPLTVIADQLGVPRSDMGDFKKWSDASVAPLGGIVSREEQIECARLVVELQKYLLARAAERRIEPTDDLLSDMVHASVDGETSLTDAEVVSIAQQFLVAGNETSTNLIAGALMFLLQDGEQWAKLKARPELVPNAVEEALRCETPVQGMWRVAACDTELGGVAIPKGSFMMLRYAAANRDPAVFSNPDHFDVERPNAKEHLSFGQGLHFCPGASLARKEAAVAIQMMIDRFPDLSLTEDNDFRHHPSMLLRGLQRLQVSLR